MRRKRESGDRARIDDVLPEVISLMPNAARLRESMAIPFWADAVGEQAAKATRVERVQDGIIFVRTKSSVWSHELNMLHEEIMKRLNRRLGGDVIKKIILRPDGEFMAQGAMISREPSMEELEAQVLTPGEQKQIDVQLEKLSAIPVEAIRSAIGRQIRATVLLHHWRLMHGWKQCKECGSAFETGMELCPLCRLSVHAGAPQWREPNGQN